jgi:diguanylate cyclase (GGDEF)-like protein
MHLDVRTVLVVLLVTAILMSVTLALDLRRSQAAGLGRWNAGLGLFAAGWLLITLRGTVPALLGVAVAHGLMAAGLCLQFEALREFGGRAPRRWLPLAGAASVFVLLLPLLGHYPGMTLATSAVYAAIFVALARATLQLGIEAGRVRWLSAAVLAGAALALLARAADIWLRGGAHGVFTASALHAAAFIMLVAVTVTSSFSFLVMQRRRSEERMRHLAMYDPLTELHNRRAFMELAGRELARARREGVPTALLMIDLDHFKAINDQYGHQAGDRVLADIAARLRATVRSADLPGRYGGEEFCVLLPCTGADEAQRIAERVRAAVAQRPLGGLPAPVTVSIGAACATNPGLSLDQLLREADDRLYTAKAAGRNRVVADVRALARAA